MWLTPVLTAPQAIGRIFRYGQSSETFVYRLHYNGTISVGAWALGVSSGLRRDCASLAALQLFIGSPAVDGCPAFGSAAITLRGLCTQAAAADCDACSTTSTCET